MSEHPSRFVAVSRRSFVKGSLGAGIVLAFPLAACGNDDASTFTAAPTANAPTPSAPAELPRTTPRGTAPIATPGTAPATTSAPGSAASGSGTGRQLRIDLTFAATGGGRINNPFIAVWIEDAGGALVRTVSLWYSRRDSKYLQELTRWYTVDDAGRTDDAVDTVSSGSRVPGAYSVSWDGTDHAGATVPAADYFVCIEAAREHGPYELVRESVSIGTTPFIKQLRPNGELTAATVQLLG